MSNFTTVPDVIAGQSFPPSLWESAIMNNLNLGVSRQIKDQTLTVAGSSIDFTGIPATFAHLRVFFQCRGTTAAVQLAAWLRVNGDTGANYDAIDTQSNTTSAQTRAQFAQMAGANAPAGTFSAVMLWIPNYAGTTAMKMATVLGLTQTGAGAASIIQGVGSVVWRSTAAINQLTFLPGSGNLDIGSRISIYGDPA